MAQVVLVADDSPTIQKRAQGILKGEGFDVETVSNGVAAIKKLAQIHPFILLLDVSMPGRDGYEVCEFVKASEEFCHIPVLLVASDMEPYDAERGSRVRADGKIKKPFEPYELISAVAKFAARAEAPAPAQNGHSVAETSAADEPSHSESLAGEATEEDSPRADHEFPRITEDVAFAVPSDEASLSLPEFPASFQPEPQTEPPPEAFVASETGRAFELWEAERPPAVPEPTIAPEPVEESEPAEAPEPWIGTETNTEIEPGAAPEAEAAVQREELSYQPEETQAAETPAFDEPPLLGEQPPAADAPVDAASDGETEPILIEESGQESPEPSSSSAPQPPAIFHAPAQIAEPVLNDELAAPVPGPVSSSPESEPASVNATSLDSFSLADAASGRIRFATGEPEATRQDEPPAAEASAETAPPAHRLDWSLAYSIVYRVVEKMSPPDASTEGIEETARNLTNEIVGELIVRRSETHS